MRWYYACYRTMCKYCSYNMDGWTKLLDYDETYQKVTRRRDTEESNYGFYESWDDLRDQVAP